MSDHDDRPVTPDPPLPAHVPEAPEIEVPGTTRKEQEERKEAAANESEPQDSPVPKEPPD